MANVKNQDPNGNINAHTRLTVEAVASENEAILAVENYLRVNNKEGMEVTVSEQLGDDSFEIKLSTISE